MNNPYSDTVSAILSQESSGNSNDIKPSLFILSTPGQIKLGNTPLLIRPNYGKIDLKLFVGQIPKEFDERLIKDFFSGYGEILETQLIIDHKHGLSKGCAFVKFASMTQAEEAKRLIESKRITLPGASHPLQVKWADGEDQRLGVDEQTIPKLFVGSLPKQVTEENLTDVFSQFGPIEEQAVMRDPDGTSKGCGFVRFKNKEDALVAIRFLNGNVYLAQSDKPLEVKLAESKKKGHKQAEDTERTRYSSLDSDSHSIVNPVNPMTNFPFYKYAFEGAPYYLNPYTGQTQWEEPPVGSYVIPEAPEVPYVVKPALAPRMLKKPGSAGCSLFIFHLPNEWTEDTLYHYFKDFGTIISYRVMKDRETNKSRGFGFVSYDNPTSAQNAVAKMNGFQVGTKRLKVGIKTNEGDDEAPSRITRGVFLPY